MASQGDDELVPDQTEGYRPGQKKTLDEYQKLGKRTFRSYSSLWATRHVERDPAGWKLPRVRALVLNTPLCCMEYELASCGYRDV